MKTLTFSMGMLCKNNIRQRPQAGEGGEENDQNAAGLDVLAGGTGLEVTWLSRTFLEDNACQTVLSCAI